MKSPAIGGVLPLNMNNNQKFFYIYNAKMLYHNGHNPIFHSLDEQIGHSLCCQ